jgi:multiple sugar transport system substrate-binding protein
MPDQKLNQPPTLNNQSPGNSEPAVSTQTQRPIMKSQPISPPPASVQDAKLNQVNISSAPSPQIKSSVPPNPDPKSFVPPPTSPKPPLTPSLGSAQVPQETIGLSAKPPQPSLSIGTPASPPPSSPSQPGTPPTPSAPEVKKSPFRFIVPIIGVLVLIGLIFFGVTRFLNQDQEPEVVTLSYWGLWEPSSNLSSVFSEFESQNQGVKVNYIQQSPQDYRERLQAAIERGQGPDIFRFHNTWVPLLKNQLSPISSDVMSKSSFEATFYPVAQKDLKLGNNYVGIPLEIDGLALYYNTRIFESAGKTPPETWEELRKTAAELTLRDDQEKIIRSGVALGTTSNVDHWADIIGLMLLQNSANPADPTNNLAEDAIAFYTIFTKSDNIWDDSLPESTFAFATEKVVMMLAPSWRAFNIKEINPELEFATVPVPQLPNTNINWASYWVEGVSSNTTEEKQALAWKFLGFLSQPETLRKLYAAASQQRLFGEPYSRIDMQQELLNDPIVGAYVASGQNAQSWYLSDWTFDNGLNDRIIKYYEDAVNSVNQGQTITRSLETAAQGVVQVLSQFGVSGALR